MVVLFLSSCAELKYTIISALELGRHKITVNCYAPGVIETPLSTCPRTVSCLLITVNSDLLVGGAWHGG